MTLLKRCMGYMCVVVVVCLACCGCSKTEEKKPPTLAKEITLYNWEDYLGPTTLADFEKRFGVKVNLETFEDEERISSDLQSHPIKYDVIVCSDDLVRDFRAMKLLAQIDPSLLPNIKNIDTQFRNPEYDPQERYSVPYLWGTTGIVVNRALVKGEKINSWSVLWNHSYKGKIAMLNNSGEVFTSALKYLGYSLNSITPAEWDDARWKLVDQVPLIVGYMDPIAARDKLINNELWAAHVYSGEGMYAVDKNANLEYIIPQEGTIIWVDNFAIPRDSQHQYTAHVFINYLLEPEVSAKIANYLWYANCNEAARKHTKQEILGDSRLYPSEEVLARCEFMKPMGAEEDQKALRQFVNKLWAELQQKIRSKGE